MTEWKKFCDEKPDHTKYSYIWISDGKRKCIASVCVCTDMEKDSFQWWLPVEEPELPIRDLHSCASKYFPEIVCNEEVAASGKINFYFRSVGRFCFEINYCAFCGYQPKKQTI